MSAKLIYSLTDNENPDLHKQIGCMNGFFQLFDRHRRIAGHGRLDNSKPPKKLLPPGQENGNQIAGDSKRFEKAGEKGSKKVVKEKRRSSTESSRHSFSSSSCSSSFSSLDYTKTANPEPSPSSQNSSSEAHSRDPSVARPMQFTRKSIDLRDVVKDSMRRDSRCMIPVKTAAKEDPVIIRGLKYIDSPRPIEQPKPAKPRNSSSSNDSSFRVFPKFSSEDKDGRSLWAERDSRRRLSYDGRESRDGLRSTIRIKELPRLSLDSRQSSVRGLNSNSSSNAMDAKSLLLRDLRIEKRSSNETANMLQEPGSSRRASSVVAKLMGLVDPVPDSAPGTEKNDPGSRTSKVNPSLRKADLAPKTIQKFPIETAPWRQQQQNVKVSATPLTVYGEIEKRLADLEFKKSGKDLRALKQILEAMQKTKMTNLGSQASNENSLDYSSNLGIQRNIQIDSLIPPAAVRVTNATIGYKSPIVIMKPAKLLGTNTDTSSATKKYITARRVHVTDSNSLDRNQFSEDRSSSSRILKPARASKSEENTESYGRICGTVSPRLQPRRLGLDRQCSPDSNIRRRNNPRQPAQSNSPGKKSKPKSSNVQRSGVQGNDESVQSESNASLASEDVDNEVTSTSRADQNLASGFCGNGKSTSEQPSPVSVLDSTFYRDESPSPVKKTSNAFKDDEIPYPDEVDWTLMDIDHQSNGRKSSLSAEIEHWVQNPQATKYLTNTDLLCDRENPDHVYISQILSVSNLPREFEINSNFYRQTQYLVNPKLFLALEQHMSQTGLFEKIHRKLVFDVVNEILTRKSGATRREPRGNQIFGELCSEFDRLQGKSSGSGEQDDEDGLRSIICEDMTHWPMDSAEYRKETPSLILDLERLIFKDLISELVIGDGSRARQLFYK